MLLRRTIEDENIVLVLVVVLVLGFLGRYRPNSRTSTSTTTRTISWELKICPVRALSGLFAV
jgi:type VI protein secretion system component VasF